MAACGGVCGKMRGIPRDISCPLPPRSGEEISNCIIQYDTVQNEHCSNSDGVFDAGVIHTDTRTSSLMDLYGTDVRTLYTCIQDTAHGMRVYGIHLRFGDVLSTRPNSFEPGVESTLPCCSLSLLAREGLASQWGLCLLLRVVSDLVRRHVLCLNT